MTPAISTPYLALAVWDDAGPGVKGHPGHSQALEPDALQHQVGGDQLMLTCRGRGSRGTLGQVNCSRFKVQFRPAPTPTPTPTPAPAPTCAHRPLVAAWVRRRLEPRPLQAQLRRAAALPGHHLFRRTEEVQVQHLVAAGRQFMSGRAGLMGRQEGSHRWALVHAIKFQHVFQWFSLTSCRMLPSPSPTLLAAAAVPAAAAAAP